ncbi:chondroitin n-acetylgalactosaminyltransferase domain-containing protein [Phthorimaea operculella]|nr:chondroitin n-acetylgalactosaminyltransferase domain-containing protein [Phthorimaea operculella]
MMQTILHHNGSGSLAYTGRLKKREVHRAITLHPVKDHRQMYRMHSYFKNLRIQEIREESLDLHRNIAAAMKELQVPSEAIADYVLPGDTPLFPAKLGDPGYLGDNEILGAPIDMNRYKPDKLQDVVAFDFISKSIYSTTHSNPKRRIEMPIREAIDDVIREVMEIINAPSRQRGRIIDFNELLYGYTRLCPLHGADHILDLLLKYRRYRGRKMTAAVRRHAYLQQSFTGVEIRELPMGEAPIEEPEMLSQLDKSSPDYEDFDESNQQQNSFFDFKLNVKDVLGNGLMKLQNLPKVLQWGDGVEEEYPIYDRRIHFILPLAGRQEIFGRFMKNYEDIVLKTNEAVTLIVVLYLDSKSPLDYSSAESLVKYYTDLYGKDIRVVQMGSTTFSRGAALTEGLKLCSSDDLVFFIDVDMMFNFDTLRRIRINTIKYNQVYFPIVFSEYNPDVVNGADFNKFTSETLLVNTNLGKYVDNSANTDRKVTNLKYSKEINDDYGYFRQYGFGILSIFKCDFERVGGFDLSIKGWGMEDVQLFETFIKSNLTVYRIPDHSLVHIFHSVDCDRNLEKSQFQMCLGTKASTYGSEKHMACTQRSRVLLESLVFCFSPRLVVLAKLLLINMDENVASPAYSENEAEVGAAGQHVAAQFARAADGPAAMARKRKAPPESMETSKRTCQDTQLLNNLAQQDAGVKASAGSIRPAVASKNWVMNFPLDDILSRGNWRSPNTFARFYRRTIMPSNASTYTVTRLFHAVN